MIGNDPTASPMTDPAAEAPAASRASAAPEAPRDAASPAAGRGSTAEARSRGAAPIPPAAATGPSSTTTPPLLRGLRAKFIALNMGLAALVLAGSFTAICYMDYRSDVDETYRTLAQALNPAGHRAQLVPDRHPLTPPEESGPADEGTFTPPEIGGELQGTPDSPVPTAVYHWEGDLVQPLLEQSSAVVPETVLPEAMQAALTAPGTHGYLEEQRLFFSKREVGPGWLVAFAGGGAANAWQGLAWGLAGIGVMALGLLFLLNLRFSRWALGPVQRAWNQQQQFVADASHELKTPLTVILANNAILRRRGGDTVASQMQWVESTQVEAERMQALVADMLDLARPATEEAAGDEAPLVNLSRLVEGEALSFEAVAFERDIAWESSVAAGISVRGNATRLERLVAVLLDNACKYTEPGGTVAIHLGTEPGEAVLAVRNSGEPIAAEDLPHLFDRFYRADKARTHGTAALAGGNGPAATAAGMPALAGDRAGDSAAYTGAASGSPSSAASAPAPTADGYGLGLAIAQDIARAHRGTLTAASTAEAGTTFTLRLPLA